ncbi:sensor histidine kinase [Pedobacter cryotolerans]|uniref:GAF domain-containing sensor histidine kinase n=1 Tax=Pedobacter cryotolerans TaxID=2571270 RepID=A0A4U1C7R1_9SPHI|nr:GAF domain-containing protein [Pedobacter cryotolerans]TKC01427.1 GAF domain-containing sensor histidine kinase [Pedobacter cryotolerans]
MSTEIFRLEATRRYLDFNLNREKELDQLVMLASQICGTPISLITLMDENLQFIKAGIGADIKEMPRKTSFCTVAIETDDLMIVEDATKDVRFANIPVVADNPHIRFYASANLRSYDGFNVGTLCVYDVKPKTLSAEQRNSLIALAGQVSHIMELDLALKKLRQQNLAFMEIARIQSHELRLPVSSILGVMDLINGEKSDLNPEYLNVLNNSVIQLDEKIRTIVGYVSANSA